MTTAYHAKYFAYELTRQAQPGGVDRLSMALFDACVDLNPHQIEAAIFALRSPLSKGVVLADEVGLGKTFEAGLVLCQHWAERKRKLLITCPASLRKQWSLELAEKFNLPSVILDAKSYRQAIRDGLESPFATDRVVITSFHFASRYRGDIRAVPFDLVVIDEAHKLRNAYRPSNKMGQNIKWAIEDRKKCLLTATPLQNSLLELYGLSTILDDMIFGDVNSFRTQYTNVGADLGALRNRLQAFCKRTLRRQVLEYIQYTERIPHTVTFRPSNDEQRFYDTVSDFLNREDTFSVPRSQRHLTTLCENGFSFEYSATFGQAMKGKKGLEAIYAKNILFDYSYKYFYKDGFGKDYRILNLADDSDEDRRRLYLTACLVAFYQQQKLYADSPSTYRPFLLEKPLWVFVGGSVNAVRTQNKRQVSDVVDILLTLATFVKNRGESIRLLERLLSGSSGLLDQRGREIFATAFPYLASSSLAAEQVFDDILRVLFNSATQAALHVENLKGTDGEIALRIGENDAFGLINVGDAASLCKLCENHADLLVVTEKEFAGSLFRGLSDNDSPVNILIGSKKFTEGWNSWRVSTMGLMNIGRTEGSEIIQLFGRGVRLKGHGLSLKRSSQLEGVERPDNIHLLETLNIFGIRADYMRQFKEYLEEEGLPGNEDRVEFILPVIKNLDGKKLTSIRIQEGKDFKQHGPKPTLESPPDRILRHPVTVNWYPKLQSQQSKGVTVTSDQTELQEGKLDQRHLAFTGQLTRPRFACSVRSERPARLPQADRCDRGADPLALPQGDLHE